MSTAWTKVTAIVKHILAPHTVDIFKSDLENTIFFSLATGESDKFEEFKNSISDWDSKIVNEKWQYFFSVSIHDEQHSEL